MLPKAFAVICGVLGVMLVLASLRYHGEQLSGWSWKGIFFALGGACLFALTIRGFEFGPIRVPALGLLVSGPLLIFFSGLAADDRKIKELLIFAVAMMGVAANVIAKYIERYRWIAWIGLLVILYVAIKMIWDGWHDVHPHFMNLIGG